MTDDVLLRRSLNAIQVLREQMRELRSAAEEPIALVGMGCRFPGGADSPERFWELLRDGRDAITDVPPERWSADRFHSQVRDEPGTAYTRKGGFLTEDVHAFDGPFFGITDAEAREMDPQQRLLLETSWEALESGGLLSDDLTGERIGVFVGVSGSESSLLNRPLDDTGPYTATGVAPSITAGRIAYALGLRGPALAVDTACSSSLVAIHLAVESLRRGECTAAVAGGASAMMSPDVFVALCRMEALAADGRCKVFDAEADGYVRSEGVGMVALMRASDAAAARAPVLALIAGSAVNHDGHTAGLTVPNGRAQRELITAALAAARTRPDEVDYLEAHGTGTPLGDPIEVRAAAEVFCADRDPATPLLIGAVKSNVGHLEAAAGVAGLIKTVLALRHGEVPGNLHLNQLNPRLRADRLPVDFCDSARPWPASAGRPRVAGVSAFGFNGTNAHLVVREAPAARPRETSTDDRPAHLLALSARDPRGLRESALRLAHWLTEHPDASLADVCHTVSARRPAFPYRTALVARTGDDLVDRLRAVAGETADPPEQTTGPVAFLLNATGDRAWRSAARLYATYPAFRDHFDRCDTLLRPTAGEPIAARLAQGPSGSPLFRDTVALAYQIALVRALDGWRVKAGAVAGSGPGELAAACLAGVLDTATAGRLLAARHTDATPPPLTEARGPRLRLLHGPRADAVTAERAADPLFWAQESEGTTARALTAALADHGYGTLVSLGGAGAGEEATHHGNAAAPVHWAVPGDDVWEELLTGAAGRYLAGADVDWSGLDLGQDRARLTLPTYPFQRRSYGPLGTAAPPPARDPGSGRPTGELALRTVPSPLDQRQFDTVVSRALLPELADTAGVLHVGYYQEMLAAATSADGAGDGFHVRDVNFHHALRLSGRQERTVQLVVEPSDDKGWADFAFYSRPTAGTEWDRHVRGSLRPGPADRTEEESAPLTPAERERIRARCTEPVGGEEFYKLMRDRGVALGPSVEWVEEAWTGDGEVLARLRPAGEATVPAGRPGRALPAHPGVLDACVQLYALAAGQALADDDLFITARLGEADAVSAPVGGPLWCHVRLRSAVGQRLVGDHLLCDDRGRIVASGRDTEIQVISPQESLSLLAATDGGQSGDHPGEILAHYRAVAAADRPGVLTDFLAETAAGLLRQPADEIPAGRPLSELGLESLAAMELRKRIRTGTGVDLPVELLVDGPSLDELAQHIASEIDTDDEPEATRSAPRAYDLDSARWLGTAVRETSKLRLFCLPYGGRGASLYRDWPRELDGGVEICPVQLPGREERADELGIVNVDEAVESIAQVLKPYLDRPFAFYGHSMGGLLAYRLAHRLGGEYGPLLRHLFVGAFSAPTGAVNPLDDRILAVMRSLGFPGMPAQQDLLRLRRERPGEYERALRREFDDRVAAKLDASTSGCGYGDLRIVQSYRHDPAETPLATGVTAFHGAGDPVVPENDMRAWEGLTSGPFELRVVPGDHFFLHTDQSGPRLLEAFSETLR